jgi:hypothetical protein
MSAEFSRLTVTVGMGLSFQNRDLTWSSFWPACRRAGSARWQILMALLIQHCSLPRYYLDDWRLDAERAAD